MNKKTISPILYILLATNTPISAVPVAESATRGCVLGLLAGVCLQGMFDQLRMRRHQKPLETFLPMVLFGAGAGPFGYCWTRGMRGMSDIQQMKTRALLGALLGGISWLAMRAALEVFDTMRDRYYYRCVMFTALIGALLTVWYEER